VLAMAHHRLGQAAEARQALDEAARALDRWTGETYQKKGRHPFHFEAAACWPVPWWDWLEGRLLYREARVLIDGSPPAGDPRLQVLRARAFVGLRRHAEAEVEYARALELLPGDPQVLLEAHRNRGGYWVTLGRWGEAAGAFSRATELRPDDVYLWRFRGAAQFAAGEVDAYRRTCAAMVERFGRTDDPRTACNVLQVCVLRGDALPDMGRLLPLARVAAPEWHFGTWVVGAALYRDGQYGEALGAFEQAAKAYRPRAWDWCFRAMAHARLGQAAEARCCVAAAARWIDAAKGEDEDDLGGTRPAWGSWDEPAVSPLLLREAEALVREMGARAGNRCGAPRGPFGWRSDAQHHRPVPPHQRLEGGLVARGYEEGQQLAVGQGAPAGRCQGAAQAVRRCVGC